jgi:putative oxidoreductase
MKLLIQMSALHAALSRALDLFRSPFLLATRWYVAWQFWQSGWLKISSWDSTLELFRSEYHVPLLPSALAAYAGTFGELFFPALLALGLFSRVGALGTFAVNAMAVISYSAVLLAEGSEAALGQHVLWGFMLATLAIAGPGQFALDSLLERKVAARCRPQGVPTASVAPAAR